ncbi:unnamed protein product [Moneuplotes crassus]|uniref:Uncharacterized protein n=1 Tax=Euplotes crassus TaxID=5936 RepID=A0AAD1U5D0_EUPCR|nr:unnamed protein product [Moneuplotes crassus]
MECTIHIQKTFNFSDKCFSCSVLIFYFLNNYKLVLSSFFKESFINITIQRISKLHWLYLRNLFLIIEWIPIIIAFNFNFLVVFPKFITYLIPILFQIALFICLFQNFLLLEHFLVGFLLLCCSCFSCKTNQSNFLSTFSAKPDYCVKAF